MYFILLLLLGVSAAFAATDVDSLIVNAPGLETFPQASVVILLDQTRIELLPSGQTVRHREYLCKILDERAKDRFGDQSVRFDADEDTVVIETARTRLPGGQWIEPEKDAFTLTSAPEVQWASAYSQLKQQNVSFPGMAVGAALHFVYRVEPKPGAKPPKKPQAGGSFLPGGLEPVLHKQLQLEVSPPWKIRYDLQNAASEPVIRESEGRLIYDWTALNCPQIVPEPNSVDLWDLLPFVQWTSFSDWEALGVYVADWFWEKVDSSQAAVDGFLQITSPDFQGIPAMMNAAQWIQWNIRTVRLSLGSVGYEPHSADRVWQNRYGDPRDKAVLLTAILRAYGFAPVPVLVLNSDAPFSELPVLQQFRHVILAVPVSEDTLWFDPTAEYYPPGTLPYSCTYGKGCLLLAGTPLLMEVPAGSPDSRGARTEIRATLADDGTLTGAVVSLPQGDRAAEARRLFKDQKAQERDIYTQNAASLIGQGTKVNAFSVSDPADLSVPVTVTMNFESPDYAVRQEGVFLVEIPANPFDFALAGFSASLPQVRYPVQLPPRRRVTTEVSLALPKGYVVSYLPPALIVDNPYLNIGLSARSNASGLTWTQTIEIKGDKVPVSDYPAVRNAFETLLLPKNRLVILEKK
jgi:hypothetical protein